MALPFLHCSRYIIGDEALSASASITTRHLFLARVKLLFGGL